MYKEQNNLSSIEMNILATVFTTISLLIYTMGVLCAMGYAAHPEHGLFTHMGFAAVFFFIGMFISPDIPFGNVGWFNKFRSIYYYVCMVSLVVSLIVAGVSFFTG